MDTVLLKDLEKMDRLKKEELRLADQLKFLIKSKKERDDKLKEQCHILANLAKIYVSRSHAVQEVLQNGGSSYTDPLECLTQASALLNGALVRANKCKYHEIIPETQKEIFHLWELVLAYCKVKSKIVFDAWERRRKDNVEKLSAIRLNCDKKCSEFMDRWRKYEALWEEFAETRPESGITTEEAREERVAKVEDLESRRIEVEKEIGDMGEEWGLETSDNMKELLGILLDQCILLLGKPPCEYSIFAMGSLSRNETTPFSDLEFGILIQEENNDVLRYFRNLTYIFHMIILDFGETIIPALCIPSLNDFYGIWHGDNWFYDDVTPSGLKFDGAMPHASKTPLGRRQRGKVTKPSLELIMTPDKMAALQSEDIALKQGYHLADVLSNTVHLHGSENLHEMFEDGKKKITEIENIQTSSKHERLKNLSLDLVALSPAFALKDERHLLSVKHDLYRFPSLAIQFLKWFHGVKAKTSWSCVRELHTLGILNDVRQRDISFLTSVFFQLRMLTYLSCGRQKDAFCLLPEDVDVDAEQAEFHCEPKRVLVKALCLYYAIYRVIIEIIDGSEESSGLNDDNFTKIPEIVFVRIFDKFRMHEDITALQNESLVKSLLDGSTPYYITKWRAGILSYEAGAEKTSLRLLSEALALHKESGVHNPAAEITILTILSQIYATSGDCQQAISHLQQARDLSGADLDPNMKETFAELLLEISEILMKQNDDSLTKQYLNDAHALVKELPSKKHCMLQIHVILCYIRFYTKQGDYEMTRNLISEAHEMLDSLIGLKSLHELRFHLWTQEARACLNMADYQRAEDAYVKVLNALHKFVETDLLGQYELYFNSMLLLTLHHQGKQREKLEIKSKVSTLVHARFVEMKCMSDMMDTCEELVAIGEEELAITILERLLALFEPIDQSKSPPADYLEGMMILCWTYIAVDEDEKAFELFQRGCYVIPHHQVQNEYKVPLISGLVQVAVDLGRYTEIAGYTKTLLDLESSIDSDDSRVHAARFHSSLALHHARQGQLDEAGHHMTQSLEFLHSCKVVDSSHTRLVVSHGTEVFTVTNETEKAVELIEEQASRIRRNPGTPHRNATDYFSLINNCKSVLGDCDSIWHDRLCSKMQLMCEAIYNLARADENKDSSIYELYVSAHFLIAGALFGLNQWGEAIQLWNKVFNILEELDGLDTLSEDDFFCQAALAFGKVLELIEAGYIIEDTGVTPEIVTQRLEEAVIRCERHVNLPESLRLIYNHILTTLSDIYTEGKLGLSIVCLLKLRDQGVSVPYKIDLAIASRFLFFGMKNDALKFVLSAKVLKYQVDGDTDESIEETLTQCLDLDHTWVIDESLATSSP